MYRIFIISLFFLLCLQLRCQKNDSLYRVYLNNSLPDSTRFDAMDDFLYLIINHYPDSVFRLAEEEYQFAVKRQSKAYQGSALLTQGNTFYIKGEYEKALFYLNKALSLLLTAGKPHGIASVYSSLGTVYYALANYPKALDFHLMALKIREQEEEGDVGTSLLNIGAVYAQMTNIKKSNEYQQRALSWFEAMKNTEGKAMALSNLSGNYFELKDYKTAMAYQMQSLAIERANDNQLGIAISYDIIGLILLEEENYKMAEYYMYNALDIKKRFGDIQGQGVTLANISNIYIKQKNYAKALEYSEKARTISYDINDLFTLNSVQYNLVEIFKGLNNYKKALLELEQYTRLKDSLFEDERKREIALKSMQYDFDKKETDLKTQQQIKNALDMEEKRKQRIVIYSVSGILLLVLLLAGVIFKSLQANKLKNRIITEQKWEVEKQKELIEHQNEIVLEKQKEILDSIHYAKRIQNTLLAHHEFVDANLPDNFILFKPKDIVSGDFYWACKRDDKFYLAICDSTGHGVPGAFMSLLNIGFLSEAINEKNITEPHLVFNYVRKRLVESVSKDGQKDGFDGILACFDKRSNRLSYAAAHNIPFMISGGVVVDTKADKMPVGQGERTDSFRLFTLDVKPGDMLYFYTDGYADQFGGPKGKKFKYKQLEDLLLAIHRLPVEEQKEKLNTAFENWKGELEQVDDVALVGIRV